MKNLKTFMRIFLFAGFVFVLFGSPSLANDALAFEARAVSATVKVFPDDAAIGEEGGAGGADEDKAGGKDFRITAVRNEFAPFQVAVRARRDLAGVNVSVGDFTSGADTIKVAGDALLLVEDVTIEKPSMPTPRRVWPDPLPPYHAFDAASGTTRAVWVDLFVPAAARAGEYSGVVTVSAPGEEPRKIKITLDVKDISLPTEPHIRTAFGISYGSIGAAHKVSPNTPEARALGDAYYWFLVAHRLSPYHIPVDFFSAEAGKYLDDPRVNFLRAPFSWDKDEMQKIADRIKSAGWLDKAVFYVRDEPSTETFPEVNRIGRWIHSFNPDLKYLITTGQTPKLDEAGIQIWCPDIAYTIDPLGMHRLRKDMARGKKFWWYTCIGPKWEGSTYFIDEAATAPRSHPWMNYLYGSTGILYWSTTHWGDVDNDPWTKTETYPGGNGDGSLLYPGSRVGLNGPVASIRLKMLREGMEDYELLRLLGENIRRAAAMLGAADDYDPNGRLAEHAFALIMDKGRSNPLGERTGYLMYISRDYRDIESEREKVIDEITQTGESPLLLVKTEPMDNGYAKKGTAAVTGWTEQGAEVTVNGVAARTKGNEFTAAVALKTGKNVVTITARLGGLTKSVTRTIYRR